MSSRMPADHDEPLDADELVRQERVQRERHEQRTDGRPPVLGLGGAARMLRHRLHARESMDAPISWACAARGAPAPRVGAFSSVGRAPRLHRGCRRFEPGRAHRPPDPAPCAATLGWARASRSRRGHDDDRSTLADRGRRAVGCPRPGHRRSGCRGGARAPRRRRRRRDRRRGDRARRRPAHRRITRCSCGASRASRRTATRARCWRGSSGPTAPWSPPTRTPTSSSAAPRRCSPRDSASSTRGRSCRAPTRRSASAASARLPEPTTLGRLARLLAEVLPPTATGVRAAGGYDDVVETVAVCGGAGDSLLGDPAVRAADVYITADLRHHPASEAREQALVGGGPRSSTCRTGRASGSGSMPPPPSSAPPTPTSTCA